MNEDVVRESVCGFAVFGGYRRLPAGIGVSGIRGACRAAGGRR